ncbi:hypothetical protein PN36_29630 [Candidatus Thiomargarita nelsonii]|uniref:ABC transporter domain-containing protein n=1 Tax=Candidatus Thiomargarita nelsonii TaxID=1003181 RepID=A0A0A6RW14_9GAMM|nr:hypothetical protein PN36_29630 [Candidatus Thiomargarita nelsonii]
MSQQVELKQVSVAYQDKQVVKNVSFVLENGEIGCLLGPSGCGKTTLLRAIAGFEPVRSGEIIFNNSQLVSSPLRQLPTEKRRVGMVFQDLALFPHLTVTDNIAFGLRGWPASQRRERIKRLLQLVDLVAVAKSYPHQLSGGQQQRIALIRALAPKPALLLLDEPFSSLDSDLREQLAIEVRALLKQEAVTAILVSHSQSEAFAMADKIGVMQDGHLRQWDTGYNLYHSPIDHFVADFIGEGVFLAGTVIDEAGLMKTPLGILPSQSVIHKGSAVKVLVRPDDISFDPQSPIRAQIIEKRFRGAFYLYRLKLAEGAEVLILRESHLDCALYDTIGIRLNERKWVAWRT